MAQPFSVLLRAFILETVAGGLVDLPIQDPAIGEQLDQLMNNQGPIPNWFSQWQQQNQAQLQERFNALNLSITNVTFNFFLFLSFNPNFFFLSPCV